MIATSNLNNSIQRSYNGIYEITKNSSNSGKFLGTNEHLELVSGFNKELDGLLDELSELSDLIETTFPSNSEHAHESLKFLFENLGRLVSLVKLLEDDADFANAHESRLILLRNEVTQILEYIDDLQSFVLSRADDLVELDDLLKDFDCE